MISQPNSIRQHAQCAQPRRASLKIGILLLLLAIAGFSTLAKNSIYFSNSDPAHYINISSKMTVSHSPALVDRAPLVPVARFVPPQLPSGVALILREEAPPIPSISVTVSLQHRSPPVIHS